VQPPLLNVAKPSDLPAKYSASLALAVMSGTRALEIPVPTPAPLLATRVAPAKAVTRAMLPVALLAAKPAKAAVTWEAVLPVTAATATRKAA
jgi:hypothetical protein